MIIIKLFHFLCFILTVYTFYDDTEETSRRLHLRKLRKELTKLHAKENVSIYKKGYMCVNAFGIGMEKIPEPYFQRINPVGFKVEFYGPRWIVTNPYFDGILNGPLIDTDGDIQGYFHKCNKTDMWVYRNKDVRMDDDDFIDFAISVFIFKENKLDYIVRSKYFVQKTKETD